jgi:ring-1,2-phenylacetyl-CoA epoxidase subunit PaaC
MNHDALKELLYSLADDELVLGHRDSEWTGYAPILEEDIAFSNIAQDELGHALVWYTLLEQLGEGTPDAMAFEREADRFRSCRFVSYPKGDFAYTVVRQYLFDEAEQVRLRSFSTSSYDPLRDAAAKIIREESYHLLHTRTLVERLGGATEESHRRMQDAMNAAYLQALGIFEVLPHEGDLRGVFPGNEPLLREWKEAVVRTIHASSLELPAGAADSGGRTGLQTGHLRALLADMHAVYGTVQGGAW